MQMTGESTDTKILHFLGQLDPLKNNISLRNRLWTSHYQYKHKYQVALDVSRYVYTSIFKSHSFLCSVFFKYSLFQRVKTQD